MPSLRVGRWVRDVIVDEFANRIELVLPILTQLHGPPGGRLGAFRFDAKNMRDASAAKVDTDRGLACSSSSQQTCLVVL